MVKSLDMPEPATQNEIYRFGPLELAAGTGELRKNGIRLKLQDQPVRILTLLLENAGEVVTREQIRKRLWADGVHVDYENAINSAVRKLRDALLDTSDNPRFVETVARRGYRFIAPVTRVQSGAAVVGVPPVELPVELPLAQRKSRRPLLILTAVVAGVLISAAAFWLYARTRPETPLTAIPLTTYPGYESSPSFSPDGNQVAFSWNGEKGDNYDIYVKLIGSDRPLRLTTDPARDEFPAWSPDGRSIALLRRDPAVQEDFTLVLVPALGGPEREIAQFRRNMPKMGARNPPALFGWSPDGRWLLVGVQEGELVRVSAESGEKSRLTTTDGSSVLFAAIAPGGRSAVFARANTAVRDLFELSLTPDFLPQGEARRITFEESSLLGLARAVRLGWAGDDIVFSSDSPAPSEGLWRVPVSGAAKPRRLPVGVDASSLAISPRSHRLIYEQMIRPDTNIWRLDLTRPEAPPASFIASTQEEINPQYSPDGTRIAFVSRRSGYREIWVCDADGSNPIQLTDRKRLTGSPGWSPDSRHIVFDSLVGDQMQVHTMDANGGHARQLTSGRFLNGRPAWSHDGKWLYFMSGRTGVPEIWKLPADGGDAVRVTRNGGHTPRVSEDGSAIYYISARVMMRAAPDGSGETRLFKGIFGYFSLTHEGIYYQDEQYRQVHFFSFATGRSRVILTPTRVLDQGFTVSPDGHWLLYVQRDGEPGSDLMLVENFH